MKGFKDPVIAIAIGAGLIPGVFATPRYFSNIFSRNNNADIEKRTDTPWTNCWTGNGFNVSLGEIAVNTIVNEIPTSGGKSLRPSECFISRPIGASMAKFCNVSPRNRTVSRSDVTTLFNKVLSDCTEVHGTGIRHRNQFQASLFGTQGWPGGAIPEWAKDWDPDEEIPISPKKRRAATKQEMPTSLLEHFKRQNQNSCAAREAAGIEYKPYPLRYECTGGIGLLPNGQCPTDGVTPATDCSSWCETSRTFFFDAPFYWEPDRAPICDTASLTLQSAQSRTVGTSFGAGWSIADPRGLLSVSIGVSVYEEKTYISGQEWQKELFNQSQVCAKAVRIPGKVESCGTLTKCAIIDIPGGPPGSGILPQRTCGCGAPESIPEVCAYWDYKTPISGNPIDLDTVEYTWRVGNTHGGKTGLYAGDEWQDKDYLYSIFRPKVPADIGKKT